MGAVFLGTPAAAIPSLAALADVEDIDLVITQPDRGASRGKIKTESPVKTAARQFGFAVSQPESPQDLGKLLVDGGFNVGVIVGYGRILTPVMLAVVQFGFLNVHFSLLPRWRGAAPVERAIEAGDERTGVTLMKVDEGLDTGPILGEIATPIAPNETGGSLTARLSYLGASLVDGTMPEYLNGRRRPVSQIASGVSYAERLTKIGAQLTSGVDVAKAERRVRAFQPRPGAWIETAEGPLRLHAVSTTEIEVDPGTITLVGTRIVAGFANGALELLVVQPPGKSKLSASAWMHGRRGEPLRFD